MADPAVTAAARLASFAPGFRLRAAWVAQQTPRLMGLSCAEAVDVFLQLFIASDLRDSCDGSLPPGLDRSHNLHVPGAHVVQLLQAVDIANPVAAGGEEDHEGPPASGTDGTSGPVPRGPALLKVCLTDGAQVVCGIERKPVAALRLAKPGTKFILGSSPLLRRGLLLLEPRNLEALGLRTSNAPAQLAVVPAASALAATAVIDPSPVAAPLADVLQSGGGLPLQVVADHGERAPLPLQVSSGQIPMGQALPSVSLAPVVVEVED